VGTAFTIRDGVWFPGLAVTPLPTEFFVAWSGDPAAAAVSAAGVVRVKADTGSYGEMAVAAAGDSALIAFGTGYALGYPGPVWTTIETIRLRGIVTVDYPLLEIALFDGGVTDKRRISQANTSAPPSFTHFDAVAIGPNKDAVAYELGLATPAPRTRIYLSVIDVVPPRRRAAGR